MIEFYRSHLYLFSQGFSLVVYLAGIASLYKYRKSIIIASFLALPHAFYSLMLVPVYWHPNRIMLLGIGIEDFIFTFFTGGLIWFGVLLFLKKKLIIHYYPKQIVFRYFICIIFGISSIFILYFIGINDMLNPFITMILIITIILIYKKAYFLIFLFESLASVLVYTLGLKIALTVWPDLMQSWSWKNLWGISLFGIPVEELAWAFLYGGSWSLTIAFILGIKFNKERNLFKKQRYA
jgi:hypothetical protein